jgi:hypothetical protein
VLGRVSLDVHKPPIQPQDARTMPGTGNDDCLQLTGITYCQLNTPGCTSRQSVPGAFGSKQHQ